jgi:hypothetical protein
MGMEVNSMAAEGISKWIANDGCKQGSYTVLEAIIFS